MFHMAETMRVRMFNKFVYEEVKIPSQPDLHTRTWARKQRSQNDRTQMTVAMWFDSLCDFWRDPGDAQQSTFSLAAHAAFGTSAALTWSDVVWLCESSSCVMYRSKCIANIRHLSWPLDQQYCIAEYRPSFSLTGIVM